VGFWGAEVTDGAAAGAADPPTACARLLGELADSTIIVAVSEQRTLNLKRSPHVRAVAALFAGHTG